MAKTKDEFKTTKQMDRVKKLPESYGIALETIIDSLDKDWQNRIMYGKYIDLLCDIFEDALKNGKSVEEVCGPDIFAYAKKFQKEHDFRDLEATDMSRFINQVMLYNIVSAFGLYTMANPITMLLHEGIQDTMNWIYIVIGVVIMIVSAVLKYQSFKRIQISMVTIAIACVLSIVLLCIGAMINQGIIFVVVATILMIVFDFNNVNRVLKKIK